MSNSADDPGEFDVGQELEKLKEIKERDAPECSDAFCDDPAPFTHIEDEYADGFPVCEFHRDVLRGEAP